MPIFRGSRYEGSKFTAIVDSEGVTRKYVHPHVPKTVDDLDGDFRVVPKQIGDELDDLAANVDGGKERLWWVIADVSGIQFAFEIEDGEDLVIPSPTQFARFP